MASTPLLRNLIQYVVFEVGDRGVPVLITRLVKLLYLIDVEHYRAFKRPLTGLEWIRYKFGPFSWGLRETTRGLGFDLNEERVEAAVGELASFRTVEPPKIESWLPFAVQGIVDRVIRRWADEDLGRLLDYVYLETEPMENAQFGQALDFRTIDSSRRARLPEQPLVNKDDVKAIRELLARYSPLSLMRAPRKRDEDLDRALSGMEEAPDLSGLDGKVVPNGGEGFLGWEGNE